MKSILKIIFVFFMIVTLKSCTIKPIVSSYDYQENICESVSLEELGNGKILIYNGADFWHKIDNTSGLNIWINEKPMGFIRAGEYGIIELENATLEFKLLHVDMFKFRSYHKVTINEKTKVIRIEPTFTSNDLTVVNQLPKKFEKYEYIDSR